MFNWRRHCNFINGSYCVKFPSDLFSCKNQRKKNKNCVKRNALIINWLMRWLMKRYRRIKRALVLSVIWIDISSNLFYTWINKPRTQYMELELNHRFEIKIRSLHSARVYPVAAKFENWMWVWPRSYTPTFLCSSLILTSPQTQQQKNLNKRLDFQSRLYISSHSIVSLALSTVLGSCWIRWESTNFDST